MTEHALEILLQARNQTGPGMKGATDALRQMKRELENVQKASSGAFGGAGRVLGGFVTGMRGVLRGVSMLASAAWSLGKTLFGVFSKAVGWVWDLAKGITSHLVAALSTATKVALGLGAALGAALGYIAKKGIDYNAMMESYSTTLEVVLGSAKKAAEAMTWLKNFAAKTPFELPEIVKGGQLLATYQLEFKKWIPLAGDLAAAFGGTALELNEVISALGRISAGQMGEAMEILRRFGIGAQALTGAGISFNAAGQPQNTPEEMLAAVESIITKRYPGMMAKLSRTTLGMMSNLRDAMGQIIGQITEGLTSAFQTALRRFLAFIDAFRASAGGRALFGVTGGLFEAIGNMIQWVESVAEKFFVWLGKQAESGAISDFLTRMQTYAEMAVGALVRAGAWIVQNWPGIWETAKGVVTTAAEWIGKQIAGIWSVFEWLRGQDWAGIWNQAIGPLKEFGAQAVEILAKVIEAMGTVIDTPLNAKIAQLKAEAATTAAGMAGGVIPRDVGTIMLQGLAEDIAALESKKSGSIGSQVRAIGDQIRQMQITGKAGPGQGPIGATVSGIMNAYQQGAQAFSLGGWLNQNIGAFNAVAGAGMGGATPRVPVATAPAQVWTPTLGTNGNGPTINIIIDGGVYGQDGAQKLSDDITQNVMNALRYSYSRAG